MSTKRPRTIQIFLPDGDPAGIRTAEITTSILRIIEIPRSNLALFQDMLEAQQVGLYFLVCGEDKEDLYIGQSGEVGKRLQQHHDEKDDAKKKDWQRALVLVSLTNSLTQTHVLYLESLSIEKARDCDRYKLLNGNRGQSPHTPAPLRADCEEIHDIGSLLLATLGYPIFEELTGSNETNTQQILYCKRSGVDARATYTNEGMVVLKGSSAPYTTERQTEARLMQLRESLIAKGVVSQQGDVFVFEKNHLFRTPSGASCALLLSASNGWTDWKTETGVTLRDYQDREQKQHTSESQ